MTAGLMPRKRLSISVDSEILEAIEIEATKLNTSISRLIETVLINHSKDKGLVNPNYLPLGETRGGDRTQTKQEKK